MPLTGNLCHQDSTVDSQLALFKAGDITLLMRPFRRFLVCVGRNLQGSLNHSA